MKKSRASLREEGEGNIMTKAILDVDDCVEGMRKFTTEIFDTGVALTAYLCMLLWYDWRLTILCMLFPPISYVTAEKMKKVIQKAGAAYKEQSGQLSTATLDRAENAMTYRAFGLEKKRQAVYEENLTSYEKAAVKSEHLERCHAADLPHHLYGGRVLHFVFRSEECAGYRLASMEYCFVYNVPCMLCKAFRKILQRRKAL